MKPPRVEHPAIATLFGKGSVWRVRFDPSKPEEPFREEHPFLRVIPCSRGGKISGDRAHIFIHDRFRGVLGFAGLGVGLRREILRIPGVKAHQTGDKEFSVTFPAAAMDKVALVVRARRRKVMKPKPPAGTEGSQILAPGST